MAQHFYSKTVLEVVKSMKKLLLLSSYFLLILFISSCSDDSDINEPFENDPYYGDSYDGGDLGDPGYKEE